MTERSIFLAALDIADPAQRAAYLGQACGNDAALRRHIDDLIAAEAKLGGFLARPHAAVEQTSDLEPVAERPGSQIGPYKLLQVIGEGGMGIVYMAEQEQPVRRRVALKIIKPGMDSRQVIARFEAERQALAMMDHQNIAKVLDAGTTQSGRPYFVMELVHGVPLTRFCDDSRLTPRERLELFVPVCHAIQHAHQKGVIHRDIKPSNILVTMYDDKPVPKVIDFGVAKAVEQRLTEKTLFTQYGTLVGTFEYMSPEQAEMNAYGVDTRSDIYSLGVLLYELLTGTTPLERPKMREAALVELVRMIKEQEPPRPSIRLSSTSTLPKFAAACRTEPARLSQLLRGELDWIVMKALEKDRTRRYETASGLARDISRYLSDEPVEACPPSAIYRLKKLVRRNKGPVLAASLLLLALLIGIAGTTWGLIRSETSRRAEAKQRQLADAAAAAERQAKDAATKQRLLAETNEKLARAERVRAESAEAASRASADQAKSERDDAQRQRDQVAALNETLKKHHEQQRGMIYSRDMNLLQAAWTTESYTRVRDLLHAHRPAPGQSDLRGFEWHYWNRQIHLASRVTAIPEQPWRGVFSADGSRVATTPYDWSLWDTVTGRELSRVRRPESHPFAFDPLGRWFANPVSQGDRFWISVFDAASGKNLHTIREGHRATNHPAPAVSASGMHLAAVYRTSESESPPYELALKIWEAATGKELFALPPERLGFSVVSGPALSPDGTLVALGGTIAGKSNLGSFALKVFDLHGMERSLSMPSYPYGLCYSPDGTRLAAAIYDTARNIKLLKVYSVQEGIQELFTCAQSKSSRVSSPTFSPDGRWLAYVGSENRRTICVDSALDGTLGFALPGHASPIVGIGFSPDSQQLLSVDRGGAIHTWDLAAAHSQPAYLHLLKGESTVAFTESCARIATAPRYPASAKPEPAPNVVTIAGATGAHSVQTVPMNGQFSGLTFSADGQRLSATAIAPATGDEHTAEIRVFDAVSAGELCKIELPSSPIRKVNSVESRQRTVPPAALSPAGDRLAAVVFGDGNPATSTLRIWDVASGRPQSDSQPMEFLVMDLEWSPDGRLIAGTSKGPFILDEISDDKQLKGNRLVVWDANTGQVIWQLSRSLQATQFSDDGKWLYGIQHAFPSAWVKIWEAETGRELHSLELPKVVGSFAPTYSVAVSNDLSRVAAVNSFSSSGSEPVLIWELARPQQPACTLPGLEKGVEALAFSPDDKRLVTSSGQQVDGETKIWNASTGELLLTLNHGVRNLKFNKDGTVLQGFFHLNQPNQIMALRWDASPPAPQVEAHSLLETILARLPKSPPPTREQLATAVEAVPSLTVEVRNAALDRARTHPIRDPATAVQIVPGVWIRNKPK